MGEDLLGFVVDLDGALGRERGFGAVVVERGEDEAVDGGHDEDFAGEGGHFWECCGRAVSGCGGHVFVGRGGGGGSRWCYITVGGQVGGRGVMQSDVYDGYAPVDMARRQQLGGIYLGVGGGGVGGGSLLHLLGIMALDWWGGGLHLEMGDHHHNLGGGVAAAVGYVFMT